MDLDKIPILKALKDYNDEDSIPFHMPGHKKGNIYNEMGFDIIDTNFLRLDITEIPGMDDLHYPQSSIKSAQQMAAQAFGAEHTFFLVNGTTAGIYSMILAVTQPGDKIIVPRNCHKSVINAVIMGRLIPVYIKPQVDKSLGISMGISVGDVDYLLKKHPETKAVVITNPTYYGICSDIEYIAKVVHKHNKLLLVDEAHGAHLKFNDSLPKCALTAGADIVAQSTHKTLTSMTQSSMLHVNTEKIDIDKLKYFLQITQTTSPSHLLLASLDMTRYLMENKGKELLEKTVEWSKKARQDINHIKGIYCIDKNIIGKRGVYDIDDTRLTINVRSLGLTGAEMEYKLRKNFNIQIEMSDLYNIVLICTIGDKKDYYKELVKSMLLIAKSKSIIHYDIEETNNSYENNFILEQALLPCETIYNKKRYVPIIESMGKINADMIIPYPPGIPIIMPGEVITEEIVQYIINCMSKGIKIIGIANTELKEIRVI